MWGRVGNVITDAKFYENLLRGFGVTGPPLKRHFLCLTLIALTTVSVSTTVLHYDTALRSIIHAHNVVEV